MNAIKIKKTATLNESGCCPHPSGVLLKAHPAYEPLRFERNTAHYSRHFYKRKRFCENAQSAQDWAASGH